MDAPGLVWALCWVPALCLAPGLAVASALPTIPDDDDPWTFLAVSGVAAGVLAYLGFWLFWIDPGLGEAYAFALPCAAIGVVVMQRRRVAPVLPAWGRWQLLTVTVAAFYLFVSYALTRDLPRLVEEPLVRFLPGTLPPDNQLPLMFADRLHEGTDVRPYLFLTWQSSDRPPLQAAFTLMVLPWSASETTLRTYQVLGTWLQCWWVTALGVLAARAGLGGRATAIALGACILLPFFLLHGVFVWPKLLAAALCVLALASSPLVLHRCEWPARQALVAGAATGLALLAHAAPTFTLAGALLAAAVVSVRVPWTRAALAAATAALLLAPWIAYVTLYDPPGNLLLKMHLAGVGVQDGRGVIAVIADAYAAQDVSGIVRTRLANLAQLFVTNRPPATGSAGMDWLLAWLEGQFRCLFQALGLLTIGVVLAVAARWRPRTGGGKRPADWASTSPGSAHAFPLHLPVMRLLEVPLASLLVWVAIMFEPGGTVLHQGSFADVILLAAVGAVGLATLRGAWLAGLGVVHVAAFVLFVIARPLLARTDGAPVGTLDPVLLGCALLAALLLPMAVHRAVVSLPEGRPRTHRPCDEFTTSEA